MPPSCASLLPGGTPVPPGRTDVKPWLSPLSPGTDGAVPLAPPASGTPARTAGAGSGRWCGTARCAPASPGPPAARRSGGRDAGTRWVRRCRANRTAPSPSSAPARAAEPGFAAWSGRTAGRSDGPRRRSRIRAPSRLRGYRTLAHLRKDSSSSAGTTAGARRPWGRPAPAGPDQGARSVVLDGGHGEVAVDLHRHVAAVGLGHVGLVGGALGVVLDPLDGPTGDGRQRRRLDLGRGVTGEEDLRDAV